MRGVGTLSDGTGLLGSGIFSSGWDVSQWGAVEWGLAAFVAYSAITLFADSKTIVKYILK